MNYLNPSDTPFRMSLFLIILAFLFPNIQAQETEIRDYSRFFEEYGLEGCFMLFDVANNKYILYNPELCEREYIPASTFKIPNSLIALEEGIVKDTNQVIPWNGYEWPHAVWNKDQRLPSAIKTSCIWVFFKIAEDVGIPKYQEYLTAFNYGNKNLDGPPDRFWLSGDIRISARQQIDFLEKFYTHDLPVASAHIETVKSLILLEQTENYKLYGKTGAGELSEDEEIMWLVGFIERDGDPYLFALNYVTSDYVKTKQGRMEISRAILKDLRLIE